MRFIAKIILVCILCTVLISILYFIVVLGYSTVVEFNPNKEISLKPAGNSSMSISDTAKLSLLSWNIGYAGLGKEMDFFYEEGKMVRPSKQLNEKYLSGIKNLISSNSAVDFFLLQEVDFNSKRSYRINQYERICEVLTKHTSVYGHNYNSWFVPLPLYEPMGKVKSGMVTFSHFEPIESKRIATPAKHAWPKKLFLLKRCFIYSKYLVSNGKKLVIVNLHNSAFDDESEMRKAELEMLQDLLISEYEKGNYVIAGGDWNQNPVGFKKNNFQKYLSKPNWPVETDYLPIGWNWASDFSTPTNRGVQFPFDINKTETTILDFFVTSPNIEVLDVKTMDLGFENSDHHPVMIKVMLLLN